MNDVIYFDPVSLSLWINETYLEHNKPLAAAVKWSALGFDVMASQHLLHAEMNEEDFQHSFFILSSIWHEKRHFLDYVLTNHGNRYFRDNFLLMRNLGVLLNQFKKAGVPLVLPLDSLLDPITRKSLTRGFTYPEDLLRQIDALGQAYTYNKTRLAEDNIVIGAVRKDGNNFNFSTGGLAQFEALAYMTQQEGVGYYDFAKTKLDLGRRFLNADDTGKTIEYRWFEIVGERFKVLDLVEMDMKDGTKVHVANVNLMTALIYGALNGPSYTDRVTLGRAMYPSERLLKLLQEAEVQNVDSRKLSASEAWDITNRWSKKLFGKTCIDEIKEDIATEEKNLESTRKHDPNGWPTKWREDYVTMRSKLVKTFINDPEVILNHERCVPFLSKLAPIPVFVSQRGAHHSQLPKDVISLFEFDPSFLFDKKYDKISWAHTMKVWPVSEKAVAPAVETAIDAIKLRSPLLKAMVAGRSYPTMLGAELNIFPHIAESMGINLVYDPCFLWPKSQTSAQVHWTALNLRERCCDFCGEKIQHGSGILFSPWVFKASEKNSKYLISKYGNVMSHIFYSDWSYWMGCDTCNEVLKHELEFNDL